MLFAMRNCIIKEQINAFAYSLSLSPSIHFTYVRYIVFSRRWRSHICDLKMIVSHVYRCAVLYDGSGVKHQL